MMAAKPDMPISYKLPNGWQEQPPGQMDLVNFSVAGHQAELSVKIFPGEGASQLNLVNVMRDTMKLPPLSNEELAKIVEPVAIGGETGSLINLSAGTSSGTNSSADSILVAVVPHGGVTWFFKFSGAVEAVTAQKPVLLDFLKSVTFNDDALAGMMSPHGQTSASANTGKLPSQPALPASQPAISDSGKPDWQIPANWKEVPPTEMLMAKFVVSAKDGEADVTVSHFPGSVGGLLPNINRWRRSVGATDIGDSELEKSYSTLDVTGGKAMLVDVNGKNPRTGKEMRLVGVIWPREGETWFYKLMGDATVAGGEKDAFLKFVQSVHYPNG